MIKIEAYGTWYNNDFCPDDREEWNGSKSSMPTCPVRITVEKWTGGKTKKQRGYYWAVLVPHTLIILRDICGYADWLTKTVYDAHDFLKYMFNPVYVPNPENPLKPIRLPGTTRKMSKDRKMEYIDSIIAYGQACWNYTYPPPIKKKDKYEFATD